jgi:hypothetical protein
MEMKASPERKLRGCVRTRIGDTDRARDVSAQDASFGTDDQVWRKLGEFECFGWSILLR